MRNKWKVIIGAGLVLLIGGIIWAQQPVAQGPQASNAAAWLTSVTTWANGTLGAMQNYGTSPGAVLVPGVNAFVTNAGSIGTPTPSTSSTVAFSRFHVATAAAANVKASAGNLYGLVIGNSGTIPCWIQFMNTAGTPTAGTSVIDAYMAQAGMTVVIPAGGLALENFATGIGIAGAIADNSATTTGCTTTVSVTIYYF
jgi:hypothetical protein